MSKQKMQTLAERLEKELAANRHINTWDLVFQAAVGVVKQYNRDVCNWRDNRGTGLWECHYGGDYTSDCGLEWNMPNKLSPRENEMNFCPKCGRKLVETKPPSEVQEKIYEQEMDKIKFCGCGCIIPDGVTRCDDCEELDDM